MTRSSSPSWVRLVAGATLAWLGISVLMAAQDVAWTLRPLVWVRAWGLTMTRWAPGLLLTLAVFALARTAPIRSPHWKRHLALHAGAALVLTVLGVAMQQGLLRALRPGYAARVGPLDGIRDVLRQRGVLFLMLYAGLVGLYHAVEGFRPDTASEEHPDAGPTSADDATVPNRIVVRAGDALVPVPIADIEWVEAADSYVRLHLADGEAYLHRASMTAMMDRLAERDFRRVHRSTIVRLDAIERLETPSSTGHYAVVLRDGTRRRVSDSYRDSLLDALGAPS